MLPLTRSERLIPDQVKVFSRLTHLFSMSLHLYVVGLDYTKRDSIQLEHAHKVQSEESRYVRKV